MEVHPLTSARWDDLTALFGERGAYAGCWCMWWRVPNKEFMAKRGEGNRCALQALVDGGTVPGLLAYDDGQPVGWISLGPRAGYGRFATMRSPTYQPVDDQPVWSIVCFYIAARHRRRGVAKALLAAAIAYARMQGARILEAYPNRVEGKANSNSIYMGTESMFTAAGFVEVAQRNADRPVMRLAL
jgi:GNAT superfamily N-acetyltransferase